MIITCDNRAEIKVEESQLYLKVTVGEKTWYWTRATGEFDGTSFPLREDSKLRIDS